MPKDVSEDLSHSDTRLSVMLNGLELHLFNRSELYAKIERTFGLKPSVLVPVMFGSNVLFSYFVLILRIADIAERTHVG